MAGSILLVTVAGRDKPGLMSMLTSTLAAMQVQVLDVGQAVIHDQLALGFLLYLEPPHTADGLEAALIDLLGSDAADLRFEAVTPDRYAQWAESSGHPRYIITLLAQGSLAEELAAVSAITRASDLNIDTVRRLSDRLPADSIGARQRRSIVEMRVRGHLEDPPALRRQLLEASQQHDFDFSVQEDTVYRRNRRLVAFDMDSTLIDAEVIDELAKLHGVGDAVAEVTERAMQGELDFKQSFEQRVALLAGLEETALQTVANAVELNDGAKRLISVLRHFGYTTAVISGGFQYVGEHLQAELGIDYVFANRVEIEKGVMTGRVSGPIIDADAKAARLRDIALTEELSLEQTIAVGDGANDLPMLSVAGLGIAYHAKPVVKASAGHAISNFGLDSVLYLMGFSDRDLRQVRLSGVT